MKGRGGREEVWEEVWEVRAGTGMQVLGMGGETGDRGGRRADIRQGGNPGRHPLLRPYQRDATHSLVHTLGRISPVQRGGAADIRLGGGRR